MIYEQKLLNQLHLILNQRINNFMNPNGNFASFTIKPIELISKIQPNNWINSPKAQHLRIIKHQSNPFQPRLNINTNLNVIKKQQDLNKEAATMFVRHSKNRSTFDQAHLRQFQQRTENVYRAENYDTNFYCNQKIKQNQGHKVFSFENLPPNVIQYDHMHKKLNVLQDKLSLMKQKLSKKKQQRKNQSISQQQKQKIKKDQQNTSALKQIVSQVNCNKQLKAFSFNPYSSGSNIYYVSEILRAYKLQNTLPRDHLINSLNQLKALSKIRGPNKQQLQQKKLKLTKKHIYQAKKTVIFDLDQTLIHCNENINFPSDVKLKIKFPTGQNVQAGINIRPHAVEILKNLSKNFEVIVFTASHSCYANQVLDYLDPQRQYISHRLFRQHCYHTPEGVYIKDLRIINRQLSEIVLIDNAAYSYALQIQNGIPIVPYYEGKVDFELKALQKYLDELITCRDVRDVNRNTFKLNKYIEFDNPQTLVNYLYGDLRN